MGNFYWWNGWYQNKGWFWWNRWWNFNRDDSFMKSYVDNFDFETSLSLESFESVKDEFKKISSTSWLRKIYDAYLDKVLNPNNNQQIEIDIWFAKVGYQEKRKSQWKSLLTEWFLNFLEWIWKKLRLYDKNNKTPYENFKDFLEVFLSYHKYFNPSAK